MNRHKSIHLVVLTISVFSLATGLFAAKPRAGLSLGIGIGGMFASDADGYMGLPNDLYPEFQIEADLAFIRAGVTAGFIYREYREWDWWGDYFYDEKLLYMPLTADLALMPLRFFASRSPFQIYLGGCAGVFIDLQGNRDANFCVGPKAGLEFYLGDWAVIDIEGRYVIVPDDEELSYFNALFAIRFRIPFLRRAN
jgi:hypothetical protein